MLRRLKAVGVDYIFANGGTDFPSLIEALSGAPDGTLPEALTIPHETAAVAMAHGYYMATGKPQAAMVHTNVGLANAVMGVLNAAEDRIPMLVFSGRSPVTEQGRFGSRVAPIQWAQEMFDQSAMVREAVKWEYELRFPEQAPEVIDRAWAIAMSEPRGPVYISLPREVLAETYSGDAARLDAPLPAINSLGPSAADLRTAVEMFAAAERPIIVSQRGVESALAPCHISALAERVAAPVVEHWPTRNAMSADHPLHAGVDDMKIVEEADLIFVLDGRVPWIPVRVQPQAGCKVIQGGTDPQFATTPMRTFPCDLTLTGGANEIATALLAEMDRQDYTASGDKRRAAGEFAARYKPTAEPPGDTLSKFSAGQCMAEILDEDALIFSELGVPPNSLSLRAPGRLMQHALSGGLGWALPAALGAQLADRSRLVLACTGDGSHIFANPVACHQIAAAYKLPVIDLVLNNAGWGAVRNATKSMYPEGTAVRANTMPVADFTSVSDFATIAQGCGISGARVETVADLREQLAAARRAAAAGTATTIDVILSR